MSTGRVRVYLACSLDGYIAGPNHELDWLASPANTGAPDDAGALTFEGFTAEVGAMLMGRTTHDVVRGMDGPWPYGDMHVLVPTHRPLESEHPHVRAVSGSIDRMLDEALELAKGQDVYVDGGSLVRQALAAGRVDELVLTYIPIALGAGLSLFGGIEAAQRFTLVASHRYSGMQQLVLRPQ